LAKLVGFRKAAERRREGINDAAEFRRARGGARGTRRARIIRRSKNARNDGMEAEQLNQIANTLAGLRDREAQLRRYL